MNISRFISMLLFLVLLGGCDNASQTTESMRLGIHAWTGYEPFHLSRSLGHLDDNIKLVEFASASNIIRAMKNGSIDAATLTLDEALLVQQSGLDIRIVLVNDFSDGGDSILLNKKYSKGQSLKGLRIGVEGGAVGAYTLLRALEVQGLSLGDVTVVQLSPSEQWLPLKSGEVDGVVTFEPFRTRMLADGAIEVFSSKQIPLEITDVTVITDKAYHNNPELVVNLVNSWFESLDYIGSQQQAAYARMALRMQLTPEEVSQGMAGMYLPDRAETEALLKPGGKLQSNAEKLMKLMLSEKLLTETIRIESLFN